MNERTRQRLFALFIAAGSGFLLALTIVMIWQGNLVEMVSWAAGLLLFECLVDAVWLLATLRWLMAARGGSVSLRLAAAAIVLHAIRVVIFVLGRAGPWEDFDRRPEFRTGPPEQWFWVYFTAGMALLSVVAVIVVWQVRRHRHAGR